MNEQTWAKVDSLQGGKFVQIMRANLVTEAISLTDEQWEDWGEEILGEWTQMGRLTFGLAVHEPKQWEIFYAHGECVEAQLDALVLEGE